MGTSYDSSCRPGADSSEMVKFSLLEAIKASYRHFNMSFVCQSKNPLGETTIEAIHFGPIKSRDKLFITTKLWCTFAQPHQVVHPCKLSLGQVIHFLFLFL
ncbi:hypothetical protein T459_14428 [Capsicum annuum]|uniref:Uncharacterized protein n=1 Tax=Capsicum annuum TaxID=4072 RepID=A0A2G2ZHF4_CAPAN|nr:hypothetical protein T459_14428 [Capsicum annuum]